MSEMLSPRRRYLQFRLRTLFCVIAMAAIVFGWPRIRRYYAFWRLQTYTDIDLKQLSFVEQERLTDWSDVLVGRKLYERFGNTRLLQTTTGRFYVIQIEEPRGLPDTCNCQLHIFTDWAKAIGSFRFKVGESAYLNRVEFHEPKYGFVCLSMETDSIWIGKRRQYYRVTDAYVELLRIERLDGTMAMANYGVLEITERPAEWAHWQQLIASNEPVDQLRGLAAIWSKDFRKSPGPIDETTERRLVQLSKSTDPWIREGSRAALLGGLVPTVTNE